MKLTSPGGAPSRLRSKRHWSRTGSATSGLVSLTQCELYRSSSPRARLVRTPRSGCKLVCCSVCAAGPAAACRFATARGGPSRGATASRTSKTSSMPALGCASRSRPVLRAKSYFGRAAPLWVAK
eukprot:scaffold4145_cov115-Isochrysis_galbana.AAC.12